VNSTDVKPYEVEGLYFEFSPNGSPYVGTLRATDEDERGPYEANLSLKKAGSRERYARKAAELYGMDGVRLERALNEVCTRRSEEAEALVSSPGVLNRYVKDVARIRGVVKDQEALRLQTLVALGAQLAPLPGGKPAGANLILTAEAGRGKNYVCDAVASMLPEGFFMAFESASAKSLYYRQGRDGPERLHPPLDLPERGGGDGPVGRAVQTAALRRQGVAPHGQQDGGGAQRCPGAQH
jgi:hypothetical protein